MKVLMTGATGLVGREVGKELVRLGHKVFVVSRDREKALKDLPFPAHVIEGDLGVEPMRDERIREVDSVIHLAGENIAGGRWSSARKKRIYDSRVKSSQNLVTTLAENKNIKVFISASAIGIYGDRGDQILNESAGLGQGFLSEVCQDWEQPLIVADRKELFPHCRVMIMRFGIVLSPFGGAVAKMMGPVRSGVAGRMGSGLQWMSWIHIKDLVQLILACQDQPEARGIINAVAPEPATNKEFMTIMTGLFQHRLGLPVPSYFLKSVLGEMSQVLLYSQRVESQVIPKLKFNFQFPQLRRALEDVCSLWLDGDEIFFSEQYLAYEPEKIFPFFAEAKNLQKITPPSLNFEIRSVSKEPLEDGALINYRLKIHGLPIRWRSEIHHWQPPHRFEDLQLRGPYSKWHHVHQFDKMGGGTLMSDLVRYRLPLGGLGSLVAGRWVQQDINSIFKYRREAVFPINFESIEK